MRVRFSDLWTWNGTLSRCAYALIGLIGFAIKHNLDRFIATGFFGRPWSLFNYWIPLNQAIRITSLSPNDGRFLLGMVIVSLQFIWVGVVCTLKRLRDAGLPLAWVAVFFLPFANLASFLFFCLVPSQVESQTVAAVPGQRKRSVLGAWIPRSRIGSATVAAFFTGIIGVAIAYFAMDVLGGYGWGVFVALPFWMGLASALMYGYHHGNSLGNSILVSLSSVIILALLLLVLGWEGLICILMAAPLGAICAVAGGAVGWLIQSRISSRKHAPTIFSAVLFFVPALMGVEHARNVAPPVFEVRSSVEIDAPPTEVWKRVVAFTQIPRPDEVLFRLGIAYPIRAEIVGHGPGAERRCLFSTGAFVEPIEVWDEPRLLKFLVTSNPAPMQEWTLYSQIQTPHLHGYLVSNAGQFLLTELPGGRTRLEGTTWYHHSMWPAAYWKLWSDHIIHQIHMRVLRHIKMETEQQFVPAQLE